MDAQALPVGHRRGFGVTVEGSSVVSSEKKEAHVIRRPRPLVVTQGVSSSAHRTACTWARTAALLLIDRPGSHPGVLPCVGGKVNRETKTALNKLSLFKKKKTTVSASFILESPGRWPGAPRKPPQGEAAWLAG